MTTRPRKRSRLTKLYMLAPATTLLVAACSPVVREEPGVVYQNADECAQQNPEQSAQCQADFQAAQAVHPQTAPKYVSQAECEADFGAARCEAAPERHSQGSFFMPMMMGYMAGQMLGRPTVMAPNGNGAIPPLQDRQNTSTSASRGVPTQPLYKARDDQTTFRTATNEPVAKQTGPVSVRPDNVRLQGSRVARSGGFGSTAARMSTGG